MALLDTKGIDLRGQVAVVTGGGRGLGRAMAQALSAANAKIAVTARTEEQLNETVELIRQSGGEAMSIPTDVTDRTAVENMVRRVNEEMGEIDILVNNAGVFSYIGPIWEMPDEDWHQALDVNLTGAFLCATTVLKSMVARRQGRIINIASGASLRSFAYSSAYCVSKTAIARLTESIADDAKNFGVTAYSVDPGPVHTALSAYLIESTEAQTYIPWFGEAMRNGGALPPEWSANLVTLLASGKADHLSGRFISVEDDLDNMIKHAENIQKENLYTLRLKTLSPEN